MNRNDKPYMLVCRGECEKELPYTLEYFYKDKRKSWGMTTTCKACIKKRNREHYHKPEVKERVSHRMQQPKKKEAQQKYNKQYRELPKNKERIQQANKDSWERIKADPIRHEASLIRKRLYYQDNKTSINKLLNTKYKEDIVFRERKKELANRYRTDPNNLEYIKQQQHDYRLLNRERLLAYQTYKRNLPENKKHQQAYQAEYRRKEKNILRRNERYHERKSSDPCYLASRIIRSQVKRYTKITNKRKNSKTFNILGYSKEEFIAHLNTGEYTFNDYMTNTSKETKFHIDHIIPVSYYAKKMMQEESKELTELDITIIQKANNLRNLRVWPADANMSKHDKLDMDLVKAYNIADLL